MLTRLDLLNFKSWRHADLRFGRVTGLFGPNSSGKSSLLQFLLIAGSPPQCACAGPCLQSKETHYI